MLCKYFYLGLIVFFSISCEETLTPEIVNVKLNEAFEIGFNDTAIIEGEDFTLKFTDVSEDSRCPIDVICVWQGRLVIELTIDTQEILISSLNHSSFETEKEVVINGYKISFLDQPISPTPISSNSPSLDEYRVSLKVELL